MADPDEIKMALAETLVALRAGATPWDVPSSVGADYKMELYSSFAESYDKYWATDRERVLRQALQTGWLAGVIAQASGKNPKDDPLANDEVFLGGALIKRSHSCPAPGRFCHKAFVNYDYKQALQILHQGL